VLQPAIARCLARFKATSRTHAESDLRAYFGWWADHRLDPLATARPQGRALRTVDAGVRQLKPSTVVRGMSIVAGFHRTAVIDGPLEQCRRRPRPRVPADSPTLGPTHLQLEVLLTMARPSPTGKPAASPPSQS